MPELTDAAYDKYVREAQFALRTLAEHARYAAARMEARELLARLNATLPRDTEERS